MWKIIISWGRFGKRVIPAPSCFTPTLFTALSFTSRPCHSHKEIARKHQCFSPAIAKRSGFICFSSFSLATLGHGVTLALRSDGTDRFAIAIAIGRGAVGRATYQVKPTPPGFSPIGALAPVSFAG